MESRYYPNRLFKKIQILTVATATVFGAMGIPQSAFADANDKLIIGRAMDLNSLDPARAFCDTCQLFLTATYETLLTLNADNKSLAPKLAESWEVNSDFTEFTFHLKDGATFSDGTPVEAKDVKWSLERLKNLKGSPSFLMDGVLDIKSVDKKTVKISVKTPNSEFLNKVSAPYTAIVNSDVAKAAGALSDVTAATKDKAESWFLENSAGSGPFILAKYAPEAELRIARNDAYWGKTAAFSEIVITQIKDSVSQSQALESGAIDIAMQVDGDTVAKMTSPDVVTKIIPSFNFLYVAFSPGAKGMAKVLTPDVREALTLAIDYEGMLDFTVGGNGVAQAAPIPNGFPGTSGLPLRHQNVSKAKAMLEKAGYGDGMSLVAGYPNDNIYGVDLNIMMQKVQQDFASVGVKLQLKPMTYAVWRAELTGDGLPVTAIYYAPDYFGSGQYISYFAMMPNTPWVGRAGQDDLDLVTNPKEAALYEKALANSGAAAEAIYQKLGEEMMKENIIIPLVSPNLVMAYRKGLKGLRYSACCNMPLAEISR